MLEYDTNDTSIAVLRSSLRLRIRSKSKLLLAHRVFVSSSKEVLDIVHSIDLEEVLVSRSLFIVSLNYIHYALRRPLQDKNPAAIHSIRNHQITDLLRRSIAMILNHGTLSP